MRRPLGDRPICDRRRRCSNSLQSVRSIAPNATSLACLRCRARGRRSTERERCAGFDRGQPRRQPADRLRRPARAVPVQLHRQRQAQGNYYPGGGGFRFSPVGDCGLILAFPQAAAINRPSLVKRPTASPASARRLTSRRPSNRCRSLASAAIGSSADPFSQTTSFSVVDSGSERRRAHHRDDDVRQRRAAVHVQLRGQEHVRARELYFRAIYAGDLFVAGAELGTGVFSAGPPRFIGGQSAARRRARRLCRRRRRRRCRGPPSKSCAYPNLWTQIKAATKKPSRSRSKIDANEVDDAVGVEWDQLRTNGLAPKANRPSPWSTAPRPPPICRSSRPRRRARSARPRRSRSKPLDTAGVPYANRSVVYSIGGANPKSGSVTTDASGVATISYVGTAAGLDAMQMFLDLNGNGSADARRARLDRAGHLDAAVPDADVAQQPLPRAERPRQRQRRRSRSSWCRCRAARRSFEVTVPTATISRSASTAEARRCKRSQIRIKGRCRAKTTVSGKVAAAGRAGVALKLAVKPSSRVRKALSKGKTCS